MSTIDSNWKPSPRYLLRKSVVNSFAAKLTRGSTILELGFGGGDLLKSFAKRGLAVFGFDFSEAAREQFRAQAVNGVTLYDQESDYSARQFDCLAAFEVLEHIEDDHNALRQWRELLKPGGTLLLSVPSHQKKWGPIDVWAGHFRRYERADLKALLEQQGFTDVHIKCYGFPLTLVLDPLLNKTHKKAADALKEESMESRTKASGITRQRKSIFDVVTLDLFLWPWYLLQKLFFPTEFGSGYVVKAIKK
ncbi:MAG: class I SAM-dependent methyltransferase [bacterium]|nr:class I SAM-dependent methyltransferase [bacterium]